MGPQLAATRLPLAKPCLPSPAHCAPLPARLTDCCVPCRSTLIEEGTGKSLTRGMGSRVWPFTMDKGVPINCDWFGGIQKCNPKLRLPLWEIPVWNLAAERKSYTMDYGDDCALDGDNCLYRILKKNFDASCECACVPCPLRPAWLNLHAPVPIQLFSPGQHRPPSRRRGQPCALPHFHPHSRKRKEGGMLSEGQQSRC